MALTSLLADVDVSNLSPASDLQSNDFHPLGNILPDISSLTTLLEQTNQLSARLNQSYLSFEPEPRIVALLKEHTSHAKVLDDAKREVREYTRTLHTIRKSSTLYGEDVPVSTDQLPAYVLDRIGEWNCWEIDQA